MGFGDKGGRYRNAISIFLDTKHNRFDFYIMENGNASTVQHEKKPFTSKPLSAEMMVELTSIARDFAASHPIVNDSAITFVLPDDAVTMDTIVIPNINRRTNENGLQATITGLYKNADDLIINTQLASQTKQVVTYSLTIANKQLYSALAAALADAGMAPHTITFASNAVVNAVAQLSPKDKNASFLLMDIKHHYTRVTFVAKGRVSGFYSLPFGFSILHKNKVQSEDMLFDHSVAELAVLNAREKAKAKQLTVIQDDDDDEENENDQLDSVFGGDENATEDPTKKVEAIKTLQKKEPRKLPKFMQRPIPHTDEEFGYENFRIFQKWALLLLESNAKLISQGEPEFVLVNMPLDLAYLFDMINAEQEENGIEFRPLDIHGDRDDISERLELYGGVYASQGNRGNIFSNF